MRGSVGSIGLRILIFIVRLLPLRAVVWLGGSLGTLGRWLSPRRYRLALANLDYAYGSELSRAEKVRIAKESFRNFGRAILEVMKFAYLSQEEMDSRFHPEGFDEVTKELRDGEGAVGVTAHLGPFELGARWATARGYGMYVLAREARDPHATKVMLDIRRRNNTEIIFVNKSLKGVVAALRRGKIVGIACDQNSSDVVVPFFGKPTGTADGVAKLARLTKVPIVFVFVTRQSGGKYSIVFEGPLRYEPTGDEQNDIAAIMTMVNEHIENAIRRDPEQWLWFHNRWRSSPRT